MTDRVNDDDYGNPCSGDATCASGGDRHCHMYTRYPNALDDAGDGCCVKGCYLDEKNGSEDG